VLNFSAVTLSWPDLTWTIAPALGNRKQQHQQTFWVAADKLGDGPSNPFYDRFNQLLGEADFDGKFEKAVEPLYEKTGRKELPPGVKFRMIFNSYIEEISPQRVIAWRFDDGRLPARSSDTDRAMGRRPTIPHCRSSGRLMTLTDIWPWRSQRWKRFTLCTKMNLNFLQLSQKKSLCWSLDRPIRKMGRSCHNPVVGEVSGPELAELKL
jgi:hypothetical protein